MKRGQWWRTGAVSISRTVFFNALRGFVPRKTATVASDHRYAILHLQAFPGTLMAMETTPFDLTPVQKGLLEAIPSLLDEALEGLKAHVRQRPGKGEAHGGDQDHAGPPPHEAPKPIWEQFIEAFQDVPDEELERLPVDGAAQHDHYIYGLPKRPA
jgi:hypothetical protein